jgi:hypothetical protein
MESTKPSLCLHLDHSLPIMQKPSVYDHHLHIAWPSVRKDVRHPTLITLHMLSAQIMLIKVQLSNPPLELYMGTKHLPVKHETPHPLSHSLLVLIVMRSSVISLHTAVFALSTVLMLGFVVFLLRPFLAETVNEARRISELLSQLPAEVSEVTRV